MRPERLQELFKQLSKNMRELEAELEEMRGEHDPLATHIFIARRNYRRTSDNKSGKPKERAARFTYHKACELGFRGSFGQWEQLLGGMPGPH